MMKVHIPTETRFHPELFSFLRGNLRVTAEGPSTGGVAHMFMRVHEGGREGGRLIFDQ